MKSACVVLIRDIAKGAEHLEALSHLFDCEKSVSHYAEHRLNVLVTVVVKVLSIQVEDEVNLVSWN